MNTEITEITEAAERQREANRQKQQRFRAKRRRERKAPLYVWVDCDLLTWEEEEAEKLGLSQAEHLESILRAAQAHDTGE